MKNVIFLGPPGCGKGTQSALIKKLFNFATVSTGELLRNIANESTEFACEVKKILASGQLVNDEIVASLIDNFYTNLTKVSGCILDGFPRNISQAMILDSLLEKHCIVVDKVIFFNVDEQTLVRRITGRFTCKNCGAIYNKFYSPTKEFGTCDVCGAIEFDQRSDDSEATVKERLEVYRKNTEPLLEFYRDKLVSIDASLPQNLVTEAIVKILT